MKPIYYDQIYSPIFEIKINELGYWRLSTTDYLIHHMGNHLPNLQAELAGIVDVPLHSESVQPGRTQLGLRTRVLNSRPVRGLLKRMTTWAYSLLFERS